MHLIVYILHNIIEGNTLTSVALVLVSSSVCTSSVLSNMLPVDVANSRSNVSSKSFSKRLFSLKGKAVFILF